MSSALKRYLSGIVRLVLDVCGLERLTAQLARRKVGRSPTFVDFSRVASSFGKSISSYFSFVVVEPCYSPNALTVQAIFIYLEPYMNSQYTLAEIFGHNSHLRPVTVVVNALSTLAR
jgi:hypothetical protein